MRSLINDNKTGGEVSHSNFSQYSNMFCMSHTNGISWFSWDNPEHGVFYDTKLEGSPRGDGFVQLNTKGVYRMSHNQGFFAPWFKPSNGQFLVDTAKPKEVQQKGRRRARKAKPTNSYEKPVTPQPILPGPTGFDAEPETLPEVDKADPSTYFVSGMWVPYGQEDPSKYPFALLTYGEKGIHCFDSNHKLVKTVDFSKEDGKVDAIWVDLHTDTLAQATADTEKVYLRSLQDPDVVKATFSEMQEPRAICLLTQRDTPLIATGGRDGRVRLWDFNNGRRLKEIDTDAGSGRFCIKRFFVDPNRPDVLFAYGGTKMAVIDLAFSMDKPLNVLSHPEASDGGGALVFADQDDGNKAAILANGKVQFFQISTGKKKEELDLTEISTGWGGLGYFGNILCVNSADGHFFFDMSTMSNKPVFHSVPWRKGNYELQAVANCRGFYTRYHNELVFNAFKGTSLSP